MPKRPSGSITTEQVLKAFPGGQSAELKRYQTGLTTAANQLDALRKDAVGFLLEPDDRETLRKAAEIVRTLNGRIEKAKDSRRRDEDAKAAKLSARSAKVTQIVENAFPAQGEGGEGLGAWVYDTFLLLLCMRHANIILTFMPKAELPSDYASYLDRWQGLPEPLRLFATYLHRDITTALHEQLMLVAEELSPGEVLEQMREAALRHRDTVLQQHQQFLARVRQLAGQAGT